MSQVDSRTSNYIKGKLDDWLKDYSWVFDGDLVFGGDITFNGSLTLNGGVIFNDPVIFNDTTTFNGLMTVTSGTHFNDNIKATFGNTVLAPDLSIYSDGTQGVFDGDVLIHNSHKLCFGDIGKYIYKPYAGDRMTMYSDAELYLQSGTKINFTAGSNLTCVSGSSQSWSTSTKETSGQMDFFTGGGEIQSGGILFTTGDVSSGGTSGNIIFDIGDVTAGTIGKFIFNNSQRASDFQIKSVDYDNILYVTALDNTISIGAPGDIMLGDDTLRTMYPNTNLCMNLGSATKQFNDLFLGGQLYCNDLELQGNTNLIFYESDLVSYDEDVIYYT